MMVKYTCTFILTVLVVVFAGNAESIGLAKINVKVIDELGAPVNNAGLKIRFSSESDPVKGGTDENGHFEGTSGSDDGVIVGEIKKAGYYESYFSHNFYKKKLGMWQPWGEEISVVMRPILNPVPMYVRNTFFYVPALDKEIGFDLSKADWVVPYGLGTHADFVIVVVRRYDNSTNFDATMILTFSNPYDGIQVVKDSDRDFDNGSRFTLSREAPLSGYQQKLNIRVSRGRYGRHSDKTDDNNHIFRVRSEIDEDGKLKRAMYGKIRGEFRFSPIVKSALGKEGAGSIGIFYYLNPDYTRNLEFDPQRNLFITLPPGEGTGQP